MNGDLRPEPVPDAVHFQPIAFGYTAAGGGCRIRHLVDKYVYNQLRVAKMLNKSKSFISQVLGLERLKDPAKVSIFNAAVTKGA